MDDHNSFLPLSCSQDDLDAAWDQFVKEHITPGRLFGLAQLPDENHPQTEIETQHLQTCGGCRRMFERFKDDSVLSEIEYADPTGKLP